MQTFYLVQVIEDDKPTEITLYANGFFAEKRWRELISQKQYAILSVLNGTDTLIELKDLIQLPPIGVDIKETK